ncbi:MAG: Asp-tRNA(Asn)/Glu-tRNA(Gln) amidotransferase subunit GatC [Proteobacteria bacterium]|nr:Asp-tRNA(Asn)/Glu-tRNA(Gln) amidotransferase subunit GatC [Pseudomonadota bacterium]MBU1714670.1 Asp-tRNA(Asn)/Glu-tRNA(Gln) amidotransferase subunit GatC [Pseudomonadota bacterium]
MKISKEEVSYVAKLARLELSVEETEDMAGQLDRILNYVDKLNELDTENVVPTTHAISVNNAFRVDEVKKSLSQEEALRNGPLQNGEAFVVPRVI